MAMPSSRGFGSFQAANWNGPDGMLYPILHRLEKKGLISSYWGKADTGRKRKYYRLHKAGLEALDMQRQHWRDLHKMLEALEGGQACFS